MSFEGDLKESKEMKNLYNVTVVIKIYGKNKNQAIDNLTNIIATRFYEVIKIEKSMG